MEQLEKLKLYDHIICIDLKCFFASVECVDRGWDPFKKKMVVADSSRGKGSIILAVSPALKALGIPGRLRIFELPKKYRKEIDIIKPNMRKYVDCSNNILKMYLRYFSSDDILVYSIDEVFIDVTSYRKLYNKSTYEIALMLLQNLRNEFGLYAAAGVGHNMLLAKLALDIEAKHNKDFIACWSYDDLETKLWPIKNLTDVWGIGRGLSKRLNDLGISSMNELAHADIYKLVKHLGIMGEELFLHANGIDISKVQHQQKLSTRKGYSVGQTLFKDTSKAETRQSMLDLLVQVTTRMRHDKMASNLIHIAVRYAYTENQPSFSMQRKLSIYTNDYRVLKDAVLAIYDNHVLNVNIRKISLSCSNIQEFSGVQLNLFSEGKDIDNAELDLAYDVINNKFGKNTIIKASLLTEDSSFIERTSLIGGHNAE
ncbi:hypothetical protein [Mycoplasma sp. P36-A1]|uniref:Y-family DNA polymerase n=1 Tax=Mycoplasma sp. P36-A1 TaxID=3252900 RepID=UPI003C2AEB82